MATEELSLQDALDKIKSLEDHNSKLNHESAGRRVANDELKQKLAEIEEEKQKRKQADLEEQGKYKEALEAKEAELKRLTEQNEQYSSVVNEYQSATISKAKESFENIPEQFKFLVKKYNIEELTYSQAGEIDEIYQGLLANGQLEQGDPPGMRPKGNKKQNNNNDPWAELAKKTPGW